ncbi:HAD family acid phosphatase [Aeromicrobium sp. UC242_57]|uniref:phosphatase domain-containing protein n=1 Tax=Aeromicrobium sp. UC242_57 TaxID=3374624 RepID=UPI00378ACFE3
MRDAVIFDMDGTLCDTTSIQHHIEGEDRDFAAFHAASAGCPPHADVVAAAKEQHDQGRAVLVVTSREFIWRDLTLDWLVRHGIAYDGLYMRIVGDYRKDVVIKSEILKQITDDGFTVVEAWDDKPAIVELWKDNGIQTYVVGSS